MITKNDVIAVVLGGPSSEAEISRVTGGAIATALREKGYNPINQLVGYLMSGDPAYITSYNQARSLIRKVERDDLIEELVASYLKEE